MSVNHYDPVSKKLTPVAGTNNHLVDKMVAPYENDDTASQAYAIGEQFIYNYKLYTATTAISIDGTIIPGTNCEESASLVDQIAPFTGATASAAGTGGTLPVPQPGDEGKFIRGDGSWASAAADDNFVGTVESWNLLSDSEKAQYKTCDFIGDEGNSGLGLNIVNGQLYCRYRVVTND